MRLGALFLVVGACAASPRTPPPAREAPPPVLVVTDGRVSLRASAYVELHVMLANRIGADDAGELERGDLESAEEAYGRSPRYELDRVSRALAECTDDACARAAVGGTRVATAYWHALPRFLARAWPERSRTAWHALEVAHASLGPEAEALFERAARELEVRWERTVPVPFTSETLTSTGIVPLAVPARSQCIGRGTRVLDCVLVHALLALASPIRDELVRKLGNEDGDRAWKVLVVHTVATIFARYQPKHRSVYAEYATEQEPEVMRRLERIKPEPGYAEFWIAAHRRPE